MKKITRLINSLEGAYAPNTIRSYRSDYMHYSSWCQEYQYDPLNIHEDKFADYILQMGESLTVATIQRRVASLSSIFNLTKSTNPTNEPVVILTFKKLRRKFGKPQKQATPLTYEFFEDKNVFFQKDSKSSYIGKMFNSVIEKSCTQPITTS